MAGGDIRRHGGDSVVMSVIEGDAGLAGLAADGGGKPGQSRAGRKVPILELVGDQVPRAARPPRFGQAHRPAGPHGRGPARPDLA